MKKRIVLTSLALTMSIGAISASIIFAKARTIDKADAYSCVRDDIRGDILVCLDIHPDVPAFRAVCSRQELLSFHADPFSLLPV